MNRHEWKQEQRRERLTRAADRAREAGNAALRAAHTALDGIPFGQPILVGHHSEKRHRRTLERSDNRMRKGFASLKTAEEFARRAAAVGTGGISSDDPDAVEKLDDKVSTLEQKRDRMKLVNKLYRKADREGLKALGFDYDELARRIAAIGYSWDKQPYASYTIANLGARIRDAKKRGARLERHHSTAVDARAEFAGGYVFADVEDNRVTIHFDVRLSRENYKKVRGCGFVWSPTRSGFTRKLSGSSVEHALAVAASVVS